MPKTPHRPVAHGAGLGARDGDYGGAGWARCHLPEGRSSFRAVAEQFECTYLFIPGGPIGLPGIVSSGGFRIEKLDGYGNCVEFLLYFCLYL